MTKTKEILSAEQLAVLNSAYPVSEGSNRTIYPRLGLLSKDQTEVVGSGKNKKINVVQASGTFYTEEDKGEIDEETGKKQWTKTFLPDEEIDVIIAFHRKQLRRFDSSLKKFISTPIYDSNDQKLPLYLDKQIIKTGTPAELQAFYPKLTQKGKPSSDLKEETILYVIYDGIMYQMNLSQSSKWEFKSYSRGLNPSTVLTTLGSAEETFGENTYRKLTFKNKRLITSDEFDTVNEGQTSLKAEVESSSKFLLDSGSSDELDEYGNEKMK